MTAPMTANIGQPGRPVTHEIDIEPFSGRWHKWCYRVSELGSNRAVVGFAHTEKGATLRAVKAWFKMGSDS